MGVESRKFNFEEIIFTILVLNSSDSRRFIIYLSMCRPTLKYEVSSSDLVKFNTDKILNFLITGRYK